MHVVAAGFGQLVPLHARISRSVDIFAGFTSTRFDPYVGGLNVSVAILAQVILTKSVRRREMSDIDGDGGGIAADAHDIAPRAMGGHIAKRVLCLC